jgi:uncharacterized membrane protein YgcG
MPWAATSKPLCQEIYLNLRPLRGVGFPRALAFLLFLSLLLASTLRAHPALADTNAQVTVALTSNDVYVSNALPSSAHLSPGDIQRLQAATRAAVNAGVPEKIALVSHYPGQYSDAYAAARALRQFLDFAGVLVLVSPRGLGVSSDTLTFNEIQSIEGKARSRCLISYAACAVYAGQLAVNQTKADTAAANRSAAIFWLVLLAILAVIIAAAVFVVRRRQSRSTGNLNELRSAAGNTLSLADSAVEEIKAAHVPMSASAQSDYDRALALRDRARVSLDRGISAADLTQANENAASAVLALQGVTKSLGIQSTLSNPLVSPTGLRCFYCGRTDRPPYVTRTIDDGKGNSMEIEVCPVDLERLEQGRTPQIQTAQYNGTTVPWWAVPNNPYYYSYGGPTWQYWLPFLIGVDVGGWYGGYGYSDSGLVGGTGDPGMVAPDGGTVDPSADMGAGNFGGWGGGTDTSTADAGGWGGDSGSGGDWGGGDSGGGGDSSGW